MKCKYQKLLQQLLHLQCSQSTGDPEITNHRNHRKVSETFSTGKQNSSKAGLTNVVYWVRICSRSLPRFISRRTTAGKLKKKQNTWVLPHAHGGMRNTSRTLTAVQYLCGTAWRRNRCPQRAGDGTCPECLGCRKPGSPQRERRQQDKPQSSPPACHERNTQSTLLRGACTTRSSLSPLCLGIPTPARVHRTGTYLEWVTKS